MPALPTKLSGATYRAMWNQLRDAAEKANGLEPSADALPWPLQGSFVPRLSNGQALAIVRAWRRAAARSSAPSFLAAFEFGIHALGWRDAGDKFVMTQAHAKAPYEPVDVLAQLWASTAEVAEDLDESGAKVAPLFLDSSWSAYEAGARELWTEMQTNILPPIPDKPPPLPFDPPLPTVPKFPWWILIAFGIGAALASD